MADYYSQTVIQQEIPIIDMTALERLILEEMFEPSIHNDAMYLTSDDGPRDTMEIARIKLQQALSAQPNTSLKNKDVLTGIVEAALLEEGGYDDINIDLSGISWETIFQPIIKRSKTLNYITIVTSWTCSKMRVDGFGGMAIMVTANAIKSHSTNDSLEKWVGQIERAEERKAAKRAQTSKSLP